MGLRIVYGRAGSGKTSYCLSEMRNALNADGTNSLVMIVPEQFSLQSEKNLARITGSAGIFRAEVLSFRRLAFRVFSEVGGISRHHLNTAGKSMLLFKIVNSLGKSLGIFSKAALRRGFTETLAGAITEFKRYDVTPEQLGEAAERLKDGQPLKEKLCDLSKIYSEFERLLHQKYLDADDDLVELYKKLDQASLLEGAEIWIDEFSGFTPQEYKVIGKLLKKAERVTISLCTDCISNESGDGAPIVFTPVRNTAVKLIRLAEANGVKVEKPVALGRVSVTMPEGACGISGTNGSTSCAVTCTIAAVTTRNASDTVTAGPADTFGAGKQVISLRFKESNELGHLEQNFYKYPYCKYYKSSGDVKLLSSANIYTEVEDAAKDIIRLCKERALRYRDIAVTMRNPGSYGSIVKNVFLRYGIPYFLDGKRSIDGHPLIVFILSALSIFTENWSYESVFRYAKTGLSGVAREELDLLENYILANGIRGNVWTRQGDWDYPVEPSGRKGEPSQQELDKLLQINNARKQVTAPLLKFREKTKGGTDAAEFCTALFELLCDTGANKRIEELTWEFSNRGQLDKAGEYRQVWNIVMDVFSQIVEVLGEEKLGTERFSEILAAGFEGYKIALIPPALDQVLVGSIERARSHDIKALYILGVNEGVLPGAKGDEGLLSNLDRDNMKKAGLELAGDSESSCMEERFMVYMALATPSNYLCLSFPAADMDGRALRPSRVISEVRRILPNAAVQSTIAGNGSSAKPEPYAAEPAFDELASQLRRQYDGERVHEGWKDIYRWFNGNEAWKEKCRSVLNGLSLTNQAGRLSGDRMARLYGKPVFTSVSRMEAYSSCPFAFYVKYGLKAKERRMFSFESVDAGTFMHSIIDEFSRLLVRKGISWRGLDKKWCGEQISRLVEEQLAAKGGNSILRSSKRYMYLTQRLNRTVLKAVMLIAKHIEMGSFEPSGFEVEFGDTGRYPPIAIELPNGESIKMTGRIDRIDTMTNEDGTYLRIIDYKSGNKALKLEDVYYGLQLQLVTYLDAVLGIEGSHAAGKDGNLPVTGNDHTAGKDENLPVTGNDHTAGKDGNLPVTGNDHTAGKDGNPPVTGNEDDSKVIAVSKESTAGTGKGMDDITRNCESDSSGTLKNSRLLPAGVLYFRLDDPLIRCDRDVSEEEIEKAIMRELRMKGLILADVKLVREMDRQIDGDSLIIPARINKDGSLGRAAAATKEQFEVLRGYVRKTLASIGSGILDGNVPISPYKKKTMTACTYCSFSSICRFDTLMRDNRYRIVHDYKDDELWKLMREAAEGGNVEAGSGGGETGHGK